MVRTESPKYPERDSHREKNWEKLKKQKRAEISPGDQVVYHHIIFGKFRIPKIKTLTGIAGSAGIFTAQKFTDDHASDIYVSEIGGRPGDDDWWPAKDVKKVR